MNRKENRKQKTARSRRPNILLIMTDQHRLSAVGAYGPTPCLTPNLDRLAREGVVFENAYTTCPVCSPARATVMTGLFPHGHGICTNIHELGCSIHELPVTDRLLSRRLLSAGYSTGYSGKWHLGRDRETAVSFGVAHAPTLPRDCGFEGQNFPGHGNGGHRYAEYREYLAERGLKHELKPWAEPTRNIWRMAELAGSVESTEAYFVTEHTLALQGSLRTRARPFFIWHNFWGPHEPYYVPSSCLEQYRNVDIPEWPNYRWDASSRPGPHLVNMHPDQELLTWNDWATALRYYYAFATMIDEQIGRMLQRLEEDGILDNTIVIFTADHGEAIGSHGGMTNKGWCHFEEIQRIPLIIRLPGGESGGRRVKELASLADVYPTVLDMAGAAFDAASIHGLSLAPLIQGHSSSGWRDEVAVEFCGLAGSVGTLRTLRWRNLKYGYSCGWEDELYDLEKDSNETVNLVNRPEWASALEQMRRRLKAWMERTGDPALYTFLHMMRQRYGDSIWDRPEWPERQR